MMRTAVTSLAKMKKLMGVLRDRTYGRGECVHPITARKRRQVHLAVDQLEARETPSATVAATSFFDSAVYEFDPGTGALKATLVAPNSSPLLSGPAGLTLGPDGNLYISSQFNDTIVKYDLTANTLSTFISASVLDPIATANGDQVFAPAGLRFGGDGNLYVSLNGGQNSTNTGAVVRFNIGMGTSGLSFTGTSTTIAKGLVQPSGLIFGTATGDTDSLYVSNFAASDIVKLANASSANPVPSIFASEAGSFPSGLNWGPDGKLYAIDFGAVSPFQGNILQISADGKTVNVISPTTSGQAGNLQAQFPSDILFDGQGHILTGNLGQGFPPSLVGSVYQFNTDGTFSKILVDSSQFPNTGPAPGGGNTSGIAISQLDLVPDPTTHFVISNPTPSSVTAGNTITFAVTAEDKANNPVPGYTGTVQLSSSDAQAGLQGPYTFVAGDAGKHTFTATLDTAGNQTVTVADQSNSTITGTSGPVTVTAGSFNKFVVTSVSGNTVTAGNPFIITTQAADQFGNPVTTFSGPITFTTTDPQVPTLSGTTLSNGFGVTLGTLKTVAGGPWTITAASGGTKGTSAPISVTPGNAVYFNVSAPSTAITNAGSTVTVTALDAFNNLATNYAGTVQLTSTDNAAVAAGDLGGSYTFTTGTGNDNGSHVFNVKLLTNGTQKITAADTTATVPAIVGTSGAVTASGLKVTALNKTPTGFTVTFNQAINPADLTIYGNGNTQQDVLLIAAQTPSQPSYSVPGTLIVDASKKLVTFNVSANFLSASNPTGSATLPDDTYTLTLLSGVGANGFQDVSGQGLDNGSGGHADFKGTFTTTYQADKTQVLGIVDFARGPNASGDATTLVKVPNDPANGGHVGIPITIYNAANLTSAGFTLTYNAKILTITGGTSDPSNAAAAFQMASNVASADGIHSVATFSFTNPTPESGTQILGDITAYVPFAAKNQYQVKELLALGAITVSGGATVLPANAVNVNAYFGDVNGDHHLDALDKALLANVASTQSTGFTAYTLLDPAIIGDVSGDNAVTSNSTSLMSNYLLALPVAKIPPLPNPPIAEGLFASPFGADPILSLPGAAQFTSGIVNVPVLLDQPHPKGSTGLVEAELALSYDSTALNLSASDISLGSIPTQGSGWQLTSTVDAATGQITIQLYSANPITSNGAGSLVNIAFHEKSGAAAAATTTVQLLSSMTVLADAQAAMILTPGISQLSLPISVAPSVATPPISSVPTSSTLESSRASVRLVDDTDPQELNHLPAAFPSVLPEDASVDVAINPGAGLAPIVAAVPIDLLVTGVPAISASRFLVQAVGSVIPVTSVYWLDDLFGGANRWNVLERVFQEMPTSANAPADDPAPALSQDSFDTYFAGLALQSDALADLGNN